MKGRASTKDLQFYAFASVLSLVMTIQSFRYNLESSQFPRFLSLCMLALSLPCLVKHIGARLKQNSESAAPAEKMKSWRDYKVVAFVFAASAAYIAGIAYVGYFVSTLVFLAGMMRCFGKHKWWIVLGPSIGFLGVVYALFVYFLELRLPEGLLF